MSVRNQNWYNLQSTRRYPLDENSTGFDDAGELIRDDVLVDCHIRFPAAYGKYLYVQGITLSAGLVSVVFGVADDYGPNNSGEPVAAITIPRPIMVNVNYPLTAIKPNVSGWVAFGPGVDLPAVWRYSTANQSVIAPRCARPFRPLPIPTLGKLGLQEALAGVVRLSGALPVKVHYVENAGDVIKFVENEAQLTQTDVPAIVVELDQAQRTEAYDPLELFLGPCGKRPESGTCDKPPIENINGITPDCDGNIEIVFEGFNSAAFENCGGVDTITDIDLAVVCAGDTPGGGGGNGEGDADDCCTPALTVATETALQDIPAEARYANMLVKTSDTNENWKLNADLTTWQAAPPDDECRWPDTEQPAVEVAPYLNSDTPPDNFLIVIDETENIGIPCLDVPICAGFNGCSTTGGTFEAEETTANILFDTKLGRFAVEERLAPPACRCGGGPDESPTVHGVYAAKNFNAVNAAILTNCYSAAYLFNKTVATELSLGPAGNTRRAGIILNATQTTMFVVLLDGTQNSVRVLRYTNSGIAQETSAPIAIASNSWYRLAVTVIPNGDNITLRIRAEELPGFTQANPPTSVETVINFNVGGDWLNSDILGNPGIFSDRAEVYFNKFTITSAYGDA